jgi:hypothetical protein
VGDASNCRLVEKADINKHNATKTLPFFSILLSCEELGQTKTSGDSLIALWDQPVYPSDSTRSTHIRDKPYFLEF